MEKLPNGIYQVTYEIAGLKISKNIGIYYQSCSQELESKNKLTHRLQCDLLRTENLDFIKKLAISERLKKFIEFYLNEFNKKSSAFYNTLAYKQLIKISGLLYNLIINNIKIISISKSLADYTSTPKKIRELLLEKHRVEAAI